MAKLRTVPSGRPADFFGTEFVMIMCNVNPLSLGALHKTFHRYLELRSVQNLVTVEKY